MRKPKLRDWFLLLVPVVLLAGFAFWRQQNEKPQEPFRLVVKEIRREKLTPLEVYEGFDTKIAVVIGHKGVAPRGWGPSRKRGKNPYYQLAEFEVSNLFQEKKRLANERTPITVKMGIFGSEPKFVEAEDAFVVYYTTRLRRFPDLSAPIILKGKYELLQWSFRPSKYKIVASIPLTHEIRRAKEKAIAPQISRYRPVKVLDVKLHPDHRPRTGKVVVSVELEYLSQEPYQTSKTFAEETKLIDAKGRVFKCTNSFSGQAFRSTKNGQHEPYYSAIFHFQYKGKPPVEPVTLDGKFSFNDCWPIHVVQKTDSKGILNYKE